MRALHNRRGAWQVGKEVVASSKVQLPGRAELSFCAGQQILGSSGPCWAVGRKWRLRWQQARCRAFPGSTRSRTAACWQAASDVSPHRQLQCKAVHV